MSIERIVSRYRRPLEDEMRVVLHCAESQPRELFGMLQYHLGWVDPEFAPCETGAGKRVRPTLCLLCCEGCGGSWETALPAAAAVELLHNFTLIHDDVEDRDETRRGRPTVWYIWGEAQGINAGDTMFALSQLALLRLHQRRVPEAAVVDALSLFNQTCVALTGGQFLDIKFEGQDAVSTNDYLAMIEAKTAALIACSCELGALVASAPTGQREYLRAFGYHAGLAFQMLDDILGIWGDPAVTGKPVGADIARRKKTLPLLHGLERSPQLRALMGRESLLKDDVQQARHLLEQAGSREYTERLAQEHHQLALTALRRADVREPAAQTLHELSAKLLSRRC